MNPTDTHEWRAHAGPGRITTWHAVRPKCDTSACGSFGAAVLGSGVLWTVDGITAAAQRSGHKVCQRCVDRLAGKNATIRCT